MKITLLPSSVVATTEEPLQFLTSYLLNDAVALDAGCLGLFGTPAEQARVRHVLLSHAHADHLATLPIFLEQVYQAGTVTLHGSAAVLDSLRRDVFNDRVWPALDRFTQGASPPVRLELLEAGRPIAVEGLRVTPVPVNHAVPTLGFVVEDATSAVAFSSDTGPTEELWACANARPHLKAVFLEASFPDSLAALAAAAGHLTPSQFAAEVRKLRRPAAVIAVHIKPRFREQVIRELLALGLPNVQIGRIGTAYVFS